jgi:hypothetical protein
MFSAAARALAVAVSDAEIASGLLLPGNAEAARGLAPLLPSASCARRREGVGDSMSDAEIERTHRTGHLESPNTLHSCRNERNDARRRQPRSPRFRRIVARRAWTTTRRTPNLISSIIDTFIEAAPRSS